MDIIQIVLYVLLGLGAGIVIGRFLLRKLFRNQEMGAQNKAKKILKDAEIHRQITIKPPLQTIMDEK